MYVRYNWPLIENPSSTSTYEPWSTIYSVKNSNRNNILLSLNNNIAVFHTLDVLWVPFSTE